MIALVVGVAFGGLLATFLVGWGLAEFCLRNERRGPGR